MQSDHDKKLHREWEMECWMQHATYAEMLRKVRFEPIGSPWFQGRIGDRFMAIMDDRRSAISDEDHTRISKEIGWQD